MRRRGAEAERQDGTEGAAMDGVSARDLGPHVSVRHDGVTPPLFITARSPAMRQDRDAAYAWIAEHKPAIEQIIVEAGAVVLRGFPIGDSAAFDHLISLFPSTAFDYSGGATPRERVEGRVFEATRAPPEMKITLHQEMAYLPRYPMRLAFYCNRAPLTGGETIIADMRAFDRRIDRTFRARVRDLGVLYTRNFRPPGTSTGNAVFDAVHRCWTDAFSTQDPASAEAQCHAIGLETEWRADGSLTTRYRGQGVLAHPSTGQEIWFNQLAQQRFWSPGNLGAALSAEFQRLYGGKPKPYAACYGNGEEVDDADIDALFPIYDDLTIAFPWNDGDVMILDNIFTAHGRNPFTGARNVQVALLN
jgi:alpha-ketoglutarate-dependent taurine dioxygenase